MTRLVQIQSVPVRFAGAAEAANEWPPKILMMRFNEAGRVKSVPGRKRMLPRRLNDPEVLVTKPAKK